MLLALACWSNSQIRGLRRILFFFFFKGYSPQIGCRTEDWIFYFINMFPFPVGPNLLRHVVHGPHSLVFPIVQAHCPYLPCPHAMALTYTMQTTLAAVMWTHPALTASLTCSCFSHNMADSLQELPLPATLLKSHPSFRVQLKCHSSSSLSVPYFT